MPMTLLVDEVHQLDHISPDVTMIVISNIVEPIALPKLPAHVEELILRGATLGEKTRFSEGLKRLSLEIIGGEPSMNKWSYPSTLEVVSIQADMGGLIDLRSVTAPKLILQQNGAPLRILYPEGLQELTLDYGGFDGNPLPPYLQDLTLAGLVITHSDLVCPSLQRLTLNATEFQAPIGEVFPQLEVLTVHDHFFPELNIKSASLQKLSLDGLSVDEPIFLDTPSLKSLTVLSASPEDNIDLSLNTELGKSLVELILESAMAFPVETDWERLTSLTLIESDVELPLIPHLSHFETDMAVVTNDLEVETLEEYKAAWNL